jgi:hypothetical protein
MTDLGQRALSSVDIFRPSIRINIYATGGTLNLVSGNSDETLISCQTFKDISQPAGQFIIHLVDRLRYDTRVKPMDVVSISMSNHLSYNSRVNNSRIKYNESVTHATMIGLVDSVKRKRVIDPQSGKPQVFCEIRGRDFGKLLVKHQIRYLPWLVGNQSGAQMSQALKSQMTWLASGLTSEGDIAKLLQDTIRHLLTQGIKMQFNVKNQTIDIDNLFSYRFSTGLGYLPFSKTLQSQIGAFWSILQGYANLPWNEIWIDTVNAPEQVIPNSICNFDFSSPIGKDIPIFNPITGKPEKDEKEKDITRLDTTPPTETLRQIWGEMIKEPDALTKGSGKYQELADKYPQFFFKPTPVDSEGNPNLTELNTRPKDINVLPATTIDESYVMIFCRQTPFDDNRWESLKENRSLQIVNDDIIEQDLGIQDHEVFNYFWVQPVMASVPMEIQMKQIGIYPIMISQSFLPDTELDANSNIQDYTKNPKNWDKQGNPIKIPPQDIPSAIEKYGLNALELETSAWQWNKKQMSIITEIANQYMLALANWNKWNAELISGTLTIKGCPDLHVGDVLYNKDEGMCYYVESVSNTYIQYQQIVTTLFLTRGQPWDKSSGKKQIEWGDALNIPTSPINQPIPDK